MSEVAVDAARRVLQCGALSFPCAIGRGGFVAADAKREGDGCTPLGRWPLRAVLFDPARAAAPPPGLALPWRWTRPDDGWSDAPGDPAYNRPVRLPHAHSAETLRRDDGLYDIVVVLGHNDAPPVPGMGSAIFLHCWRDAAPTEGCVALARPALETLLPLLHPGDAVEIVAS